MPENSDIEVLQTTACALKRLLSEDLYSSVTAFIVFLARVETDIVIQSNICRVLVWLLTRVFKLSLCENCALHDITFIWFVLCGYGHVSSNYHFVRIVHHRYHICMVSPLYGYGHVSSNYHCLRIVHYRYHI